MIMMCSFLNLGTMFLWWFAGPTVPLVQRENGMLHVGVVQGGIVPNFCSQCVQECIIVCNRWPSVRWDHKIFLTSGEKGLKRKSPEHKEFPFLFHGWSYFSDWWILTFGTPLMLDHWPGGTEGKATCTRVDQAFSTKGTEILNVRRGLSWC